MPLWMLWIPLISIFTVWLFSRVLIGMLFYPRRPVRIFGVYVHGQLPRYHAEAAEKLGTWINEFLPVTDIKAKVSNPANLHKIMPRLEEHIDHFLKIKLPAAMPVIAMFVGDKTISQLKAVFMTELETLFPLVMKEYMDQLEAEFDPGKIVAQKLAVVSAEKLELSVKQLLSKQMRLMQLTAVLCGLITGLLQLALILFFYR